MKKHISIHDVTDTTVHIFELPSNMLVHVKTCADGVAMAIVTDKGENIYGAQIRCDKHFHPLLADIISKKAERQLDEYMLGKVLEDIHDFLMSEDTLFVVEAYIGNWERLLAAVLTNIEGQWNVAKKAEQHEAANAIKKSRKNKNKHKNTNRD